MILFNSIKLGNFQKGTISTGSGNKKLIDPLEKALEGRPGSLHFLGIGWEYECIVLDAKSRVESVFGGPGTSFLESNRLFEP